MGVADLLAAAANTPIADEPDTDTQETEAPEAETSTGEAAPEGDPSSDDLAAKKAAEDETEDEAPEGDKSEAEKAALRQADYTRKTQELAEERKRLHSEIQSEREAMRAKEEDFAEVQTWLENLRDPEKAEYQLMRYFKPTMEALRDKWILESQEEEQLTERERAALRRVRELELADRARKEDEARAAEAAKKRREAQATNEFRKKLDAWLPQAAKASGLDPDEDMLQLIRNELANGKYWKQAWDLNVVTTAAQVVAKALKKTPKPETKPAPPPSLKGPGAKAPANKVETKKAAVKKNSDEYFRMLKEKYGAR